jgi:hypothetical protein
MGVGKPWIVVMTIQSMDMFARKIKKSCHQRLLKQPPFPKDVQR